MDIVFIIGLGLILLALLILIINIDNDKLPFCILAIFISCIGLSCMTNSVISDGQPTAIDVYRGKTTLEITYRDSIPVDSVVIFKE